MIELAEESGRLPAGTRKAVVPLVTARPPEVADEEKKSRVGLMEIEKGVESPQEFIRQRGRNPKHVLAELKAWKEQQAKMGLTPPSGPGGEGGPQGLPAPLEPSSTPPGSAGGDGSTPNRPAEYDREEESGIVLEGMAAQFQSRRRERESFVSW